MGENDTLKNGTSPSDKYTKYPPTPGAVERDELRMEARSSSASGAISPFQLIFTRPVGSGEQGASAPPNNLEKKLVDFESGKGCDSQDREIEASNLNSRKLPESTKNAMSLLS